MRILMKLALLALVASVMGPAASMATSVTFHASGSFSSTQSNTDTSNVNMIAFQSGGDNELDITYNAINGGGSTTTSTPKTAQSLGTLDIELQGDHSKTYSITSGTSFTLTIHQTVPGPSGQGSFSSTLSGTVSGDSENGSGTVTFSFSTTQFTIDNIKYQLVDSSGNAITSIVENVCEEGGRATVYAKLTDAVAPTPEPSTLAMVGMGGLTLLGYRLRRRSSRARVRQ
jgi:hypothetical protein